MEKILFVAHTDDSGTLPKPALEALTAAKELAGGIGGELIVGLVGQDVAAAADSIGGCGAAKFLGVSGCDFGVSRYSSDASALEALGKNSEATVIVGPSTSRFARVLPGVAQRLGGAVDTQLTKLVAKDGAVAASRWFYRQRMEGTLKRTARPWVVSIAPGSYEPAACPGSATVEAVGVDLAEGCKRTMVIGVEAPEADAQTIRPEAELLFVAGAGWTKKQADGQVHMQDAEDRILGFLNKTQSSLGSSKSLVDISGEGQEVLTFMSHLHQVGQTGSTPRHAKGLATCCHGEEPHVVGWRFIGERRAINMDAGCGWAQGKADVLYVADAFEVMAKVNELLDS